MTSAIVTSTTGTASKGFVCQPLIPALHERRRGGASIADQSRPQHLRSRAHRDETAKCPFCGAAYISASAVMHHLEGRSCSRAPMDRDELYQLLRSRDPNGYYTKHIENYMLANRYEATDAAWNQRTRAWECYLCHRGFNSLVVLNTHLNSPIHQQKLYHCPNHAKCGREFTTLAGVFSHLESESCSYMRFEVVQQKLDNITAALGRLGFSS